MTLTVTTAILLLGAERENSDKEIGLVIMQRSGAGSDDCQAGQRTRHVIKMAEMMVVSKLFVPFQIDIKEN